MNNDTAKQLVMKQGFVRYFKENLGIIAAFIVLFLFLSLNPSTSRAFVTRQNMFNVLRQISTNMYLACGMTMVIILGGIDLSVGSIIALSGCVAAACVARYELAIPVALIIGTVIGVVFGMFNGFVISKTTIPPFIVTLATMNIARGFAYVYTGGSPVRVVTKAWQFIGAGYIGIFPVPVIIMIVVLIITGLLMNNSKLGRHIYAVGGNVQAAVFSGISVTRVKFWVYAYSGLMAGIAGIVLASRMYSGQPTAGDGAEMDAIAAVVVGGTSMAGGSGKIGGTIIGALIIGFLNNGLNLMNVNSFWQYVVKGLVILLAVFLDFIRNRNKR
ncbi:ABC transporter permease [Treponema socranskii]|uniref:Branched-chain amino acid ABC transporter, permease protein n=1 Tax=Treponema socranskii subsp. socranskii VPI DR56BR1116 = ATCC 35536 TaxID=1125725 RepID=U1GW25_TRESO|nr:ABC transporter permease [Treponema socranskii]ERF60779.1 branched-chain amino acid ABC transporter, permease protein [Treponema socranskii subsp. socranskii VPI DR56BR1116 = ATCC 35536]ERK04798.1 branched-chain amino acid ABC transporter, permease protein [Treponema socranskii subsp. socranskii VPI DR56BR1116 = ATCC 35536]